MIKFKLVVILSLSLFVQNVFSEPNCLERNFSIQNVEKDELSFKANEDNKYLKGILPSAYVFFNIVFEAPVTLSSKAKIKDSKFELITSKTKIHFNVDLDR